MRKNKKDPDGIQILQVLIESKVQPVPENNQATDGPFLRVNTALPLLEGTY